MHITFIDKLRNIARVLVPAACAISLAACSAEDMDDADLSAEDGDLVGEAEQSLVGCSNVDGSNAVMAALAVSVAQELRRWQPSRDFVVFGTSGRSESSLGPQQAIKLTAAGKAQCADGKCWNTQALLDLQYDQANDKVKFPGNVTLSPGALRSRLVAKLREQQTCESRPANGGNNCPVEEHTLTFQRAEKGGCDTNFFFKATQPNGQALKFPGQLKNKLQWADVRNPYIGFQAAGDVVSIDPTFGLNETNAVSAGVCFGSCLRISGSSVLGSCCQCNGTTRKFARAPWSSVTYLCQ